MKVGEQVYAPDDCLVCADVTPHRMQLLEQSTRGALKLPGAAKGKVRVFSRRCQTCEQRERVARRELQMADHVPDDVA